jgi:hypothetical protein
MPEALRRYWSIGGKGGDLIDWGRGGDFNRCRIELGKVAAKHPGAIKPEEIDGMCANLHEINLGINTSTHARLLAGGDAHPNTSALHVINRSVR